MGKYLFLIFLFLIGLTAYSQKATVLKKDTTLTRESPFKTGYVQVGFFDISLKSILKFNNHEGIRLGLGGVTNDRLFKKYRLGGYYAYGFTDKKSKYSVGGSIRLNKKKNIWLDAYYTYDIKEFGDYSFLTDKHIYSVFQPRIINITQFYNHTTWKTSIYYQFNPDLISELKLAKRNISQLIDYYYVNNEITYEKYSTSEATFSLRYGKKRKREIDNYSNIEYYGGIPNASFQITQGFKNVFNSDFSYTKLALKIDYYIKRKKLSSTNIMFIGAFGFGDLPLTHLFHTSPNSPNKDAVLQRFSISGRHSFETMHFGEFFSDKYSAIHIKHSLFRINISKKIQPEAVVFTRYTIGDLKNKNKHHGVNFNTLNKIYSESGIELNRIFYGFGLSFAYRYGYYHLPNFDDNISFKFTFYLKL